MLRLKFLEDRFLGSFTKIEENFQEILGISTYAPSKTVLLRWESGTGKST